MNRSDSWTLADYCFAVYRFKGRALGICLLALCAGAAWSEWMPKRYSSEARLFVRVGRDNATLDPTVVEGEQVAIHTGSPREIEINSIVEHLRSREILERTWDRVRPASLVETPESRAAAIARLKGRVRIASPRQSTLVTISAEGGTPEEAQDVARAITDIYLDEHMRVSRPGGAFDFLSRQSSRLYDEFQRAQEELRDAKNEGGMASIDGRRTSLESQINDVETHLSRVAAEHAAAKARFDTRRVAIDALPVPLLKQLVGGMPNDGLAAMRDRLFQLQVLQEELRSKSTDKHPAVVAVTEQVDELASVLDLEDPQREEIIAALCAEDQAQQAALAAQEESLDAKLVTLRREVTTLNDDEMRVAQATLKVRQLETKYQAYSASTEEARIDEALRAERISNISVIQPASLSPLAVSPQRSICLLLAGFFGAAGGLVTAILSEQLRRMRRVRWAPTRAQGRSVVDGDVPPRVVAAGARPVAAPR
jgi:uncharacterized protein involved in exopolysaccharide biosynthesis